VPGGRAFWPAGKRIGTLERCPDVGMKRIDFTEFYASSRDDCLRAVIASTGDRAAAEDYVAEAFARAWASWRVVSRHPVPRAWVVRTALNLRVSAWRRYRREVALGGAAVPLAADWSDLGPVDAEIMTVLAALPERQRQVIALRVFLDLDTAGTARALGIAPGTVTAHLARAVATLRAELSPRSPTERQR
jgi:RNA polymerase sigma factor (sigma-70 family)